MYKIINKSLSQTVVYWLALTFALLASKSLLAFEQQVFIELDYGLYWFNSNNKSIKHDDPDLTSNYYDKNKKTVIYIHGWQENTVKNQFRETMKFSDSGQSTAMSKYWRSRGYNVGILYWNQFADEDEVQDAEAKIWATGYRKDVRWLSLDGNYYYDQNKTVVDLLYKSYTSALSDYNGGYIRIAGHSLGNQVAIALTKKLYDSAPSKMRPKRVALLDPFYSKGSKNYLGGQWVGERCRNYVNSLKGKGVLFEAYRSSSVTNTIFVGDENKGLMNKTAFTELKPWYFQSWEQHKKHGAAVWHYFWSMNFGAPSIKNSSDKGASARTSDSRIKTLMNGNKRLIHDLGAYTKTPSDDRMKYGNRL